MMVFYAAEIAASFVETILGIILPARLLKNGRILWKADLLAAAVLTCVVWNLNQIAIFSLMTSFIGIIFIALASAFIHKTGIWETLVFTAFYMMLIYVNDFLALSFLGIVFQKPAFAGYVANIFSLERSCFLVLSKCLLCITCAFFAKYYPRVKVEKEKFFLLTGLTIGALYHLMNSTFSGIDINAFFAWMLFLLLILVAAYSKVQNMAAKTEKQYAEFEIERARMISENYEILIGTYRKNQMFCHDLKNQYLIIRNYLKNREYEKADQYMQELEMADPPEAIIPATGIEALDVILEYKRNAANAEGIDLNIVAEPVHLKMAAPEIASLFGNLLDNAIEACRKTEKEYKWIQLSIRGIRDMTFIKIVNPYEKNGKTEKVGLHGIGLKSVKSLVEKYGGNMEIEAEEGKFSVVISFFD